MSKKMNKLWTFWGWEVQKQQQQKKVTMICISFNIYSKKDGLNIVKVILRDVIGCSIRVYKFTFLKIHKGPPKMLNRNKCCMRSATLLKKRLWHRCFAVNFVKFLRTPISKHLWWLLLKINIKIFYIQNMPN